MPKQNRTTKTDKHNHPQASSNPLYLDLARHDFRKPFLPQITLQMGIRLARIMTALPHALAADGNRL